MAWLIEHKDSMGLVALLVAEALQVVFPSSNGFGGYVGSVIRFLKNLGVKEPGSK